jgi:DNA polymerase-4
MSAFCRDCFADSVEGVKRCNACGSPRLIAHPELSDLSVAHLDCDAFYASIEKRDNPAIRDKPVIVGGSKRGVVSTACYIARTFGVNSAMPMFKALKACPDAVVIPPNMSKYASVAREVRDRMLALTPLVEPLSLDEAFLDLSGTERLHGASPAKTLARLSRTIEKDLGITVSIGLSHNKFLAKIGSEMKKPRGLSIVGRAETVAFLAERPVTVIFGVGKVFAKKLAADGITRIGQLQAMSERELAKRYGTMGAHLYHLARGVDLRSVDPDGPAKSISAETTFESDLKKFKDLEPILWELCEKLASRAKHAGLGGATITLKLRTSDFKIETRRQTLKQPTQLAEVTFRLGRELLRSKPEGPSYRLVGIGLSGLAPSHLCDLPDLLDPTGTRRAVAERAIDVVRTKFGEEAIKKGRSLSMERGRPARSSK